MGPPGDEVAAGAAHCFGVVPVSPGHNRHGDRSARYGTATRGDASAHAATVHADARAAGDAHRTRNCARCPMCGNDGGFRRRGVGRQVGRGDTRRLGARRHHVAEAVGEGGDHRCPHPRSRWTRWRTVTSVRLPIRLRAQGRRYRTGRSQSVHREGLFVQFGARLRHDTDGRLEVRGRGREQHCLPGWSHHNRRGGNAVAANDSEVVMRFALPRGVDAADVWVLEISGAAFARSVPLD
ncbi:hypothetical protein RHA1_ro06906 [Rhodococcus jostii RHA1]|uniref:Uncharacterized protein n=1 Tax=Rhodococcus jostii (strain RHA1) TaxID=101510 RepID=Q0S1B4_RHOJR|nr:hypothetical protein RHA1_ro06906 [Rhodococcus jostii RHA1]